MRVRVAYTVDVSDGYRRGIRRFYGRPRLADRQEVRDWHEQYGRSMDEQMDDRPEENGEVQ